MAGAVGSGKVIVGVRRSKWDVREVPEVVVVVGAQVVGSATMVRTGNAPVER